MRTFGGTPSDVILDIRTGLPEDEPDQPEARIYVYTAVNGTELSDLLDLDGNQLPGYITADDAGYYTFKIDSDSRDVVYGRDNVGRWYRLWSVEGMIAAAQAGEQFPAMQLSVQKAEAAAEAAADALAHSRAVAFNVLDFGAKADATTDDTLAVQAAIDAVQAADGGTLLIPPGPYVLSSKAVDRPVQLRADNMTVIAYGATFLRPDAISRAMFVINSYRAPYGYGSGIKNLRWYGGRFKGDLLADNVICGFGTHHAQDCHFVGITFDGCQAVASHIFDLVAADKIRIRWCTFMGQQFRYDTSNVSESVQYGCSFEGGLTGGTDGAGLAGYVAQGFSGLPSRDITVEDCRFLPWIDSQGTEWPCPTPMGAHGTAEGLMFDRMRFLRNYVLNPRLSQMSAPGDPEDELRRGVVHMSAATNCDVLDNTFVMMRNRQTRVITFAGNQYGPLAGTDPNDPDRGTWTSPNQPSNNTVRNNRIYGFTVGEGYDEYPAIVIRGVNSNFPVLGAVVEDNRISGGYSAAALSHSAAIVATNVESSQIKGNTIADYYCGLDLSAGSCFGGFVSANSIINRTGSPFPAAIKVAAGVVSTQLQPNVALGYTSKVLGTPGAGTALVSPDPQYRATTADQTVTNSTVLVDAAGLSIALEANSVYRIEGFLGYNSGTVPDFKFGFVVPAGATLRWMPDSLTGSAGSPYSTVYRTLLGASDSAVGGGIGSDLVATPRGTLITAATGGTVKVQFAQNSVEASNTILRAGSWLRAEKVA